MLAGAFRRNVKVRGAQRLLLRCLSDVSGECQWQRWDLQSAGAQDAQAFPPPMRTIYCGAATPEAIGRQVVIAGWIKQMRVLGELVFLVLGDWYGTVQCQWTKEMAEQSGSLLQFEELSRDLSLGSVVRIRGVIQRRPRGTENLNMKTGQIEIRIESLDVISKVEHEHIPVDESSKEDTRLRFRYLDIRRDEGAVKPALQLRSEIGWSIRQFLHSRNFTEVETPTLFKTTSEGAREFLVPTRNIGSYYALPQSPQQFKQMLMASSVDRYYQFARCYRDEDGRADRQPEFTQLDIEMAFIDRFDVMQCTADLIGHAWKNVLGLDLETKFPVLSYEHAMNTYGSDKPDLRFDFHISDLTSALGHVFESEESKSKLIVKALAGKQLGTLSKRDLNRFMQETSDDLGVDMSTIASIRILSDGSWKTPPFVSKLMSRVDNPEEIMRTISSKLDLTADDILFLTFGNSKSTSSILKNMGQLRLGVGRWSAQKGLITLDKYKFCWVVDFPLFELSHDDGNEKQIKINSTHHPFTAPHPGDLQLLLNAMKNPNLLPHIRGQHYDIVLNGVEIGGGSIRIHQKKLQERVFRECLNLDDEQCHEFHHLLEALSYGCPPHGGIALGFDRFIATICDAPTIRDVIAFPKSKDGRDLLCASPQSDSIINPDLLKVYGLKRLESNLFS